MTGTRLASVALGTVLLLTGGGAAAMPQHGTPQDRNPQAGTLQDSTAGQRWLVQLRMRQVRVLVSLVDGRPRRLQAWSSAGGAEILVRHQRSLYLVDARHGRIFQMPATVLDRLADEFDLLMPYPVPSSDEPVEDPEGPLEIRRASVELGRALLPTESTLARAQRDGSGGAVYMPNVEVQEFREVFRIGLEVGQRELEIFLESRPA